MTHFRPLILASALWITVSTCAQQPDTVPAPQAPAAQSSTLTLNSLQGSKVASIQMRGPAAEHADWLVPILPQKAGEPLDKSKVQRSVQVLYSTGRFSDIQVEAQRNSAGEVILTFAARENYFLGSIRIEGTKGSPTESQLVSASRLALGEQFSEDKVKDGLDGMRRVLEESGYYKATTQQFYEWDARNQQVKLLIVVTPGPSAHVGKITVTGSPGYTQAEILDIAKLHPGDRVSSQRLTRAMARLRKKYQKAKLLEAQVNLTQRTYRPETNTVEYTFDIVRGARVDVTVEGAKMRKGLVKKLVPVFEENAVDEDLLNEGRRNIEDYFQKQGYFDVKVSFSQPAASAGESRNVVYRVERGERHKFDTLAIGGNHYFPLDAIRERMAMQPAGGLRIYGFFSQSILARDIQAIDNLYRLNGFREIKITPTVQDDHGGKHGHVKVTISIEEGSQTTVGKLELQGNHAISTDEIMNMVSAREGQPYSEFNLANDQNEIMNLYFNAGFPETRFEYTSTIDPGDPHKIDVSYKITEGSQVFVDKVLVSGTHFTRGYVVDHAMKIRPGDALSQEKLLDTQRNLYDLGIFNSVEMAVQNPEGTATHKNVNLQLTEAKRYTFNYGFGFQVQTGQPAGAQEPQGKTGISPQVSFDITRLNFRGRDHTITLRSKYGNLEKLGLASYEAPRWFDFEHLTFNLTSFYQQTNDVRTFTAKRLEGSVEIKQEVTKAITLLYRLTYRRVSTDNLVIDPNLVPLFSRAVRVGMPSVAFIRDTRDNPINSHKGTFSTVDFGVASGAFGSEANFSRLVAQNSSYYQFHKKRWVFARSTRIGFEEPYGSKDFIPLPERFFAGGSNSHRGFGINQAGPRDLTTGFPLGGGGVFTNNLELRTPPLPVPWMSDNISAVAFHDMGNVFPSAGDIPDSFLRVSQPNRATCLVPALGTCNFNYMSHAVGGGIRYRTPIGPVSFDVGYNLNPPTFPITVGTPRFDTLKHFNYFFSIGQTF